MISRTLKRAFVLGFMLFLLCFIGYSKTLAINDASEQLMTNCFKFEDDLSFTGIEQVKQEGTRDRLIEKIAPTLEAGIKLPHNFRSEFRHIEERVFTSTIQTIEYYTYPLYNESFGFFIKGGASYSLTENNKISFLLRYDRWDSYYVSSLRKGIMLEISYLHLLSR